MEDSSKIFMQKLGRIKNWFLIKNLILLHLNEVVYAICWHIYSDLRTNDQPGVDESFQVWKILMVSIEEYFFHKICVFSYKKK